MENCCICNQPIDFINEDWVQEMNEYSHFKCYEENIKKLVGN